MTPIPTQVQSQIPPGALNPVTVPSTVSVGPSSYIGFGLAALMAVLSLVTSVMNQAVK